MRGTAHYALASIAKGYGPALTAKAAALESSYLYPERNGMRLAMDGQTLSLSADGAAPFVLGTLAPEADPRCWAWPSVTVPFVAAPGVSANLSVTPRTGIFSPPCFKDRVNGFYELYIWTTLTIGAGGKSYAIRIEDSQSFRDEPSCRAYYARLPRR